MCLNKLWSQECINVLSDLFVYFLLVMYIDVTYLCCFHVHLLSCTDVAFSVKKKKGMVLYSAVSSPLDRSKRFTLSSPGRPLHSDTVLGFSWRSRTPYYLSREPVFEFSCCHFKDYIISFSPQCLS